MLKEGPRRRGTVQGSSRCRVLLESVLSGPCSGARWCKHHSPLFPLFQANEDVTQIVEILHSGPSKWNWLTRRLVEFTSSGSVLLFVTKKANAEELANNLKQEGHNLGLLHGDMDQSERNKVISDFKKKDIPVLVATDVAGRV